MARGIWNVTIIENIKIDNENATKIILNGIGDNTNYKMIGYFTIHNKEPYSILFGGYAENYNKYLPEFESMLDSFRFK